MRYTAILFAFVVSCLSCAPLQHQIQYTKHPGPVMTMVQHVPIYIDEKFSAHQRAEIHAAIDDWNFALNGYTDLIVVDDSYDMGIAAAEKVIRTHEGIIILAVGTDSPMVEEMGDGVLAWVNEIDGNLMHVVYDRIGTRNMRAIMVHEFGHALGLPHIYVKNTVMYPNYNYGSTCIDKITLMALQSVHSRYDVNHMNFCEP
jgi:predicted Zn-dependent protease